MSAVESLVEFFKSEAIFLSAVALYGKGSANAAHPGALLNIFAVNQTADQAAPVRISGAGRVHHLLCLEGGNSNFIILRGNP